jgi:hypothetical protein
MSEVSNKKFVQLPFEFDVQKLLQDLACVQDDEWMAHPHTKAYEGIWDITALMSTNGDTRQIVAAENQEYKPTPLLKRTHYIQEVIDTFETKVEAVRFMKLGAGSIIKTHRDRGSHYDDGLARLHIPVATNEDVEFILDGQREKMDIGCCYYIDADAPHSVENYGKTDRIHLLIDCHINEWLKNIFQELGFIDKVYKYGSKGITDENVDAIIASFKAMGTQTALKMARELEVKRDGKV